MEALPGQPLVLYRSDEASAVDDDGAVHSAFQQNRRFMMLSVPKSFNFEDEQRRMDLVGVVVEAMQR